MLELQCFDVAHAGVEADLMVDQQQDGVVAGQAFVDMGRVHGKDLLGGWDVGIAAATLSAAAAAN